MKTISAVIPIYNEEKNILELYRRLIHAFKKDFSSFRYEILFIDDGSSDSSFALLSQLNKQDTSVKAIRFSRNFGHHIAITAGLDHAIGDYVIIMDGDLQDQPEEIIKLYNRLKDGFDVVYGERVQKQFSLFKRLCSRAFLYLITWFIKEDIVINTTIFRILKRKVVDHVKQLREGNRYVVGIIGWVGFRHGNVDVIHGKRMHGETKYNLGKQISLAFDAIFAFSDYPLKFISRLGFVMVNVGLLLGCLLILKHIFYGSPIMGWSSLICSIIFIGGVQIFFLGVIGEYIGRSYMETKQRPLYIIDELLNNELLNDDKNPP